MNNNLEFVKKINNFSKKNITYLYNIGIQSFYRKPEQRGETLFFSEVQHPIRTIML